jgi:hypothetical protein
MNWYNDNGVLLPQVLEWPGQGVLLGLAAVTLLACGAVLLLAVSKSRRSVLGRTPHLRLVPGRRGALATTR